MASSMTDKRPTPKTPKVGPDFDDKTTVAGKTTPNMPDRDGPAKMSAKVPVPQKPATSAGKGKAGVKKAAPSPQAKGGMVKSGKGMPMKTIQAMRADLKKM